MFHKHSGKSMAPCCLMPRLCHASVVMHLSCKVSTVMSQAVMSHVAVLHIAVSP